jgi:hypothetical protein
MEEVALGPHVSSMLAYEAGIRLQANGVTRRFVVAPQS